MKRFSVSLIGFCLFILASPAFAQCPESRIAKDILKGKPIGEYAKQVLKRADDGIARAKKLKGDKTAFDFGFLAHRGRISTVILTFLDTNLRLVEHGRNLPEFSACLHNDLMMIAAKMEEARCEMELASDRGIAPAVYRLLDLQEFLNKRYAALLRGASDMDYEDVTWKYAYSFDDPVETWCCGPSTDNLCTKTDAANCQDKEITNVSYPSLEECLGAGICFTESPEKPKDEPPPWKATCPFNTDYVPPTQMAKGSSSSSWKSLDSSSSVVSSSSFSSSSGPIVIPFSSSTSSRRSGSSLPGGKAAPSPVSWGCDETVLEALKDAGETSPAKQEYEAFTKLLEERKAFVEESDDVKAAYEAMNAFLGKPNDDALESFGATGTPEHRSRYECGGKEGDPKPTKEEVGKWPKGVLALDRRGDFAFGKSHLIILRSFFVLMQKWAMEREFADYLKKPGEFATEAERQAARDKQGEYSYGFFGFLADFIRQNLQNRTLDQVPDEAVILPMTLDTELTVIRALRHLRPVMSKSSALVDSPDKGLRKFVRNYAYYTRRTCIFRPCRGRIDRILKIIFEDDCFPHVSGKFASDPEAWKKCKDKIEK